VRVDESPEAVAADYNRCGSAFDDRTDPRPVPPRGRPRLTEVLRLAYAQRMEVNLRPELQAKLARLAAVEGRDADALVQEAVERLVDHDQWFIGEVEKGLAQIERGEVLTHKEVGARLERLLAKKQSAV
jgi:predicted transcriptional regulator